MPCKAHLCLTWALPGPLGQPGWEGAELPAVDVATGSVLGAGNGSLDRDQQPTERGDSCELQLVMSTDTIPDHGDMSCPMFVSSGLMLGLRNLCLGAAHSLWLYSIPSSLGHLGLKHWLLPTSRTTPACPAPSATSICPKFCPRALCTFPGHHSWGIEDSPHKVFELKE